MSTLALHRNNIKLPLPCIVLPSCACIDFVVLTSLLVGGAVGYYLGIHSALGSSSSSSPPSPSSEKSPSDSGAAAAKAGALPPPVVQELAAKDTETEWEDEDDDGTASAGLGNVQAGSFEECKLVRGACLSYTKDEILTCARIGLGRKVRSRDDERENCCPVRVSVPCFAYVRSDAGLINIVFEPGTRR